MKIGPITSMNSANSSASLTSSSGLVTTDLIAVFLPSLFLFVFFFEVVVDFSISGSEMRSRKSWKFEFSMSDMIAMSIDLLFSELTLFPGNSPDL